VVVLDVFVGAMFSGDGILGELEESISVEGKGSKSRRSSWD